MTILRRLIRTTGETVDFVAPLSIADIEAIIGADVVDSVLLADRVHVMVIDDNGYETEAVEHKAGTGEAYVELRCVRARKPVNVEATRLYHQVCVPGTTHQIVGDVLIVPDSDFAPRGGPLARHSPP